MQTVFRRAPVAALLALVLAAQQGSAQGDPCTDLKALRTKYDDYMVAIQTNAAQSLTKWPQAYRDELKRVEQKQREGGNLEGVLAIRKEIERFDKEKQLPDESLSEIAGLKELQLKWRKMPAVIEIERNRRIVALSQSYRANLEEAKKKLTMQGKLELAIEAKNEIDRVRTSAPVTAAEFVLADSGAWPVSAMDRDATSSASVPRFSQLPANGLVLFYDFNRDEGNKVTDRSGKGNEGKIKGPTWVADGKHNGAYAFDGDVHIDAGARESLQIGGAGKSFTVGCWCKPTAKASQSPAILISQGGNRGGKGDSLHLGYRSKNLFTFDFLVDTLETSSAYDDVGQWHHWIATYDGKERKQRLFRDGVKIGERTSNGDFVGHGAVYVGQWVNRDAGFKGLIDEVMIWNRALTESEVRQVYALHGLRRGQL